MRTKIAILGYGMLGKELMKTFPYAQPFDIIESPEVKKVDVTKTKILEEALESYGKGDWIINSSAYTNVDGAETSDGKVQSFLVNVIGARNLSELSRKCGFKIIHFSTAYVFDGKKSDYTERDDVNPLGTYARHKLISEVPILDAGGVVLRTDVLYGNNGKNFIDSIVKFAKTRPSLEVVNDQIGSPTYAKDLSEITRSLILSEKDHSGRIYHSTNQGSCSRSDLARKIIEICGIDCAVKEISTQYYNDNYRKSLITAERPQNSSLNVSSLQSHIQIRPWEDALKDYLKSKN